MRIALQAYADDYTVGGLTDFEGDRLADFLSNVDEFAAQDLAVRALDDGRELDMPAAVLETGELCVVVASGPRGNPELRVRTRAYPMRAVLGPYAVAGYFHVLPTADPLAVVRHRKVVALRPVRIAYDVAGRRVEETHETLLLMGPKIEVFEPLSDEALALARELDRIIQRDREAAGGVGIVGMGGVDGVAHPVPPGAVDLSGEPSSR